jgi:hypothetical protein
MCVWWACLGLVAVHVLLLPRLAHVFMSSDRFKARFSCTPSSINCQQRLVQDMLTMDLYFLQQFAEDMQLESVVWPAFGGHRGAVGVMCLHCTRCCEGAVASIQQPRVHGEAQHACQLPAWLAMQQDCRVSKWTPVLETGSSSLLVWWAYLALAVVEGGLLRIGLQVDFVSSRQCRAWTPCILGHPHLGAQCCSRLVVGCCC